ncbi:ATP-binding protein [Azospirillum griseum]|uniref:histidine kinase n=1 Tax=Azospirillum griseum TaxID=2496639 RepID=A0A3S0KC07_9PROT|nr:ATP-binding protein [Azospirillum griseum]RTR21487.1 response regulator [Azospirillum griseum]
MGIEGRLLLPGLAVTLAIVALWWVLIDRLDREEHLIDQSAYEQTAIFARLVEEHAAATLRRVDDLLLDLAAHVDEGRAMELSNRRAFDEGLVVGVRVYDRDGLLTMEAGRAAFRGAILERGEFAEHRQNPRRRLIIGRPYVSPDSHDTLIPVSRRMENLSGAFTGIAVADVPVASFVRVYRVLGLPTGASVTLLRGDGVPLVRHTATPESDDPDPPQELGEIVGEFQQATPKPFGHTRSVSPVDGVERIVAYRLAKDYPLIALVGVSVDAVFGHWRSSARLYLGGAAVATMVIVLLILGFAIEWRWRHQIEQALRIRNRAMAWSGDGILIADATLPGMPIVYGNPALERLIGLRFPEQLGEGALWVLDRSIADPVGMEPLRQAVAMGRDVRVELSHPDPSNGQILHLELRASPVRDEAGQLVSLIAIVRDITAHKQTQAALAEAQREAERANVAKSKFLAAASHDLRQPVQALMLLMDTLAERTGDPETRCLLGTMDRALGALKMLLDGLLDVSRLEAGAITPAPCVFPVTELLARCAANSQPVADQKGLTFHIRPCGARIVSDPMLLGRVLQNLVENALRYTDQGGVLVGCRRRGTALRIEVWDSGIGIPTDQQDDIFEEFVQVGNLGRNRDQGLGLGLAVVRRLSAMLDHRVTLRSVPGRGSMFAVEVPLADPPDTDTPPIDSAANSPRPVLSATVLVIEDDAIVREGLSAMLTGCGCTVLTAATCAQALDHANRRPQPDVIVADYGLGDGRTGVEVIRDVRHALGLAIPAVLVTGDTTLSDAPGADVEDFKVMHKPVRSEELQRAITSALTAKRNGTVQTMAEVAL